MVCSSQHIAPAVVRSSPPGMTTRSVFMELPVMVDFIPGVLCPLNTSHILAGSTLAVFHTTANQFVLSSSVIQHLCWHLTVLPVGSCSSRIVLRFRITYGGTLLPSDTANMMFSRIFSLPDVITEFARTPLTV